MVIIRLIIRLSLATVSGGTFPAFWFCLVSLGMIFRVELTGMLSLARVYVSYLIVVRQKGSGFTQFSFLGSGRFKTGPLFLFLLLWEEYLRTTNAKMGLRGFLYVQTSRTFSLHAPSAWLFPHCTTCLNSCYSFYETGICLSKIFSNASFVIQIQ